MKTYISLLRSINVGGYRIVKMETLKQIYTALGLWNVHTYLQSGNVVFQSTEVSSKILEDIISTKLLEVLGWTIPIIIIDIEELEELFANNPFVRNPSISIDFLHVTLLADLKVNDLPPIVIDNFLPDNFFLQLKYVYLHCPNGYGNTKLTNSFWENKLQTQCTTRNWKTITQLVKISQSLQ